MNIKLPKVDSTAMGREFLRRRTLRKITDIVEGIGQKNIEWLISNDKDFKDVLSKQKINEITSKVAQYSYVNNIVTVNDIISAQPEWVAEIIETHGQKAIEWTNRQFEWIREIMGLSETAHNTTCTLMPTPPIISSNPPAISSDSQP